MHDENDFLYDFDPEDVPFYAHLCKKKGLDPDCFTKASDAIQLPDHIAWVYRNILSRAYPGYLNLSVNRPFHGIAHVTRAAFYVSMVFAPLYEKFGHQTLTPQEIALTQLAALFHDAGREGDGEDKPEWERDGATLLYLYWTLCLKQPAESIIPYVEIIANKDVLPGQPYYKFTHYDTCKGPQWDIITCPSPRSLAHKFLHDSDVLDIIRAREYFHIMNTSRQVKYSCFSLEYLDFYQDVAAINRDAFEALAKMKVDATSLIERQGDTARHSNQATKWRHDCEGAHKNTLELIQEYSYFGQAKVVSPVIELTSPTIKLNFHTSKLTFPEFKDKTEEEIKTEQLFQLHLEKSTLLARGIGAPSAINPKLTPSGEEETSVAKEIRKTLRRKDIPTRSLNENNKSKQGNLNRSTALMGYGGKMFTCSGFGVIKTDALTIRSISAVDIDSGRHGHKKIGRHIKTRDTLEQEFQNLVDNQKKGGTLRYYDSHVTMHTEIEVDIESFDFVWYTEEPVSFNDCYFGSTHSSVPFLQAYFSYLEYKNTTDKILPMFRYSSLHNTLTLIPQSSLADDAYILKFWYSLCSDFLRAHEDNRNQTTFVTIKTNAMYNVHKEKWVRNIHERFATADKNYPENLRYKLNAQIHNILRSCYHLVVSTSPFGLFHDEEHTFTFLAADISTISHQFKEDVEKCILQKMPEDNYRRRDTSDHEKEFNTIKSKLAHLGKMLSLDPRVFAATPYMAYLCAQRLQLTKALAFIRQSATVHAKNVFNHLDDSTADKFYQDAVTFAFYVCFYDLHALLAAEIELFNQRLIALPLKSMAPLNLYLWYLRNFIECGLTPVTPELQRNVLVKDTAQHLNKGKGTVYDLAKFLLAAKSAGMPTSTQELVVLHWLETSVLKAPCTDIAKWKSMANSIAEAKPVNVVIMHPTLPEKLKILAFAIQDVKKTYRNDDYSQLLFFNKNRQMLITTKAIEPANFEPESQIYFKARTGDEEKLPWVSLSRYSLS